MQKHFTIIIVTLLVVIAACKKNTTNTDNNSGGGGTTPPTLVIAPPPAFGYYVVGYMPYYRDPIAIPDAKYRMCNVINYAFATINTSGLAILQTPANLTSTVTKAKANGAKVFISLNGSTTDWKAMAGTSTGITNYIKSIMTMVRQYNLAGVDVDWEFPTTSDGSDVLFANLIKQLSDSCHLDKKYYLTMAVTAGKYAGGIRDAIKPELFAYVDFVNIMAYDDFNTTVPYKQHSDMALATTCLNFWRNTKGLPMDKAVLGTPAYGRPSGITQTGTILTYNSIITTYGGLPNSDSAVVTVSGVNGNNPYTVYYAGMATTKAKAILARNMGNGIMFWEHGQDAINTNSLMKAACDTLGRPY